MTIGTRTVIEEGVEYAYGTIKPGSLSLPDRPVTVCWSADHGHVIGVAKNFRREENRIVADVEIFDDDQKIEDPNDNPPTIVQHQNKLVSEGLFGEHKSMYPGAFVKGVKYEGLNVVAGEIIGIDVFVNEVFPAVVLPDYIKKGS